MLIASQLTGSGFKVRCVLLQKFMPTTLLSFPKENQSNIWLVQQFQEGSNCGQKPDCFFPTYTVPRVLASHEFQFRFAHLLQIEKKLQIYEGKINYLISILQSYAKNNQCEYSGVHIHSFHTKVDKHMYTYI